MSTNSFSDSANNWRNKNDSSNNGRNKNDSFNKWRNSKSNSNSDLIVNNRWKMDPKEEKKEHRINHKNFPKRQQNYYRNNNRNEISYEKPIQQFPENNTINFPELSATNHSNKQQGNEYLQKCMKQNEEDKTNKQLIDVNDPKYWNGYIWIGPMYLKSSKPVNNNFIKQQNIEKVSTVIIPCGPTYYSRDGLNWFPSWKETFTKHQWENMTYQKESIRTERVFKSLAQSYENDLEKAYQEYYEYGTVNTTLEVHLECLEYDKYVEKFDLDFEENQYTDEQYYSDGDEYGSDNSNY